MIITIIIIVIFVHTRARRSWSSRQKKASNRINGTIRFSLRSGYRKTKRVGIWLVLNVAEDANQAKGEPLSLKVTDVKSGKRIYAGTNPKFVIEVTPGQAVDIHVQSSGYPRHQTILFDHGEYKA